MKVKPIIIWLIALFVTVSSVVFQRVTGPTYPQRGKISINNNEIRYKLIRSDYTDSDSEVKIETGDNAVSGYILWKRYKTGDEFTKIEMVNKDGNLIGYLPKQPPAGKLEYKVVLVKDGKEYPLNEDSTVIIRFKGRVPLTVLILHVITIFTAMLLSTKTGLDALFDRHNLFNYTALTLAFLILGGFIFGPLVQKFAFGEYWTGFPFGHDLTDNKALVALLGWLAALFACKFNKRKKVWVITAAVIMLIVYLIPHSLLGSELDYNKLDEMKKNKIEQVDSLNKKIGEL